MIEVSNLAAAQHVFMTLVTEVTDSNLVQDAEVCMFLSSLLKRKGFICIYC
jgi:hypothetical protein